MTAWLVFAALAALAAAALALPVFRHRPAAAGRGDFDLAIFRRQLADLDDDAARGAIGAGEARAARIEIERRILAAADDRAGTGDGGGVRGRASAVAAVALGVPLLSLGLYAALGSPRAPDRPLAARAPASAPPEMPAGVEEAIGALAERLRENPDDLSGWLLLGRSHAATGRFREAAEAFGNAAALAPEDADIAASWGEALFYAADGTVTPAAARRFESALALDPAHPGARYYRGMAAVQAGDPRAALDIWTALANDAEPGAPWLPDLSRRLRALAAELGVDPPPAVPQQAPDPAAPPGPGPTDAEVAAMAALSPDERRAAIEGMVARLESRLLEGGGGDVAGWRRLGRARQVLGDLPASAAAWRRAAELAPADIPTLTALAEAERALAPTSALAPAALEVYRRILALDPAQPDALWFAGLAASEAGDGEEAAAFWGRLLVQLPSESEEHRLVAARIAALRGGG